MFTRGAGRLYPSGARVLKVPRARAAGRSALCRGPALQDDRGVAISIWETREQAQKAVTTAQTWVQTNMPERIRLVTDVVGDLALFHGAPVAA